MNRLATIALLPLAALLASSSAWGLPSMAPKIRDKEIRLGIQSNTYLASSQKTVSDQGTGQLNLTVGVRGVGRKDNIRFGIEGDSLYGLGAANLRYVDIGEAYLGYDNDQWGAYIGRKRFQWSTLDSYWGLGLYQPRFRWDYLNEKENGLFGAFLVHQSEYLQAAAFGAPIFIPEQGAPFNISAGNCKTSSPWFACPSSTIALFNQPTNVRFSLEVPPIRDLISEPAVGATARIGRENGWFGRVSYTNKAMNSVLLSFEGRLDLSTLEVPAVIRPRVLRHHLYGFDLGWVHPRHEITASSIWEKPVRDVTPANWNTQESYDAFLTGVLLRSMPFEKSLTRIELSYFRRQGGNGADKGPFVSPGSSIFEPRYPFENAFSLAFYSPFFNHWSRHFLFSTKFVWDTINQGNILQSDLNFVPLTRLTVNLGMDVLGSESRSPVDFISRYQRNDRIRAGVTYVF
jgi:hypothetical protein